MGDRIVNDRIIQQIAKQKSVRAVLEAPRQKNAAEEASAAIAIENDRYVVKVRSDAAAAAVAVAEQEIENNRLRRCLRVLSAEAARGRTVIELKAQIERALAGERL